MIRTLRAALMATTFAAMAIVPAAGIVTLASVDAAHAKGGNGNAGGGGGDRGNGGRSSEARGGQGDMARGGGRPDWAGSGGTERERGNSTAAARGGSDPVSNFIRGLTGQEKREARADARPAAPSGASANRRAPTEFAPQSSIAPGKRPSRSSDMHPSELGNMNGALNANINAVLAHIRNGNVNGPVGGLAALAVADAAFAGPDRVVKQETLAALLDENGYVSVQDYLDALNGEPPAEEIPELEDAIAALGDDVNITDGWSTWRPTADEVATAKDALPSLTEARLAAEAGMLSLWNKNADTDPATLSPEETALLGDLRNRLSGHETEIEQAIRESQPAGEDEALCEGLEGCEADDEERVAAAD